jgi:hypothetical protein
MNNGLFAKFISLIILVIFVTGGSCADYRLVQKANKEIETADFGWCDCDNAGGNARISFSNDVISHVSKSFPEKSQKIVITSYGSGSLLNEYLIVSELLELGFKNLDINLIDSVYGSPESDAYKLSLQSDDSFFLLHYRSDLAPMISGQIKKFETRVNSEGLIGKIRFFSNSEEYLQSINNGESLLSNIVLGIDISSYELSKEQTTNLISQGSRIINLLNTESSLFWFDKHGKLAAIWAKKGLPDSEARVIDLFVSGTPFGQVVEGLNKNNVGYDAQVSQIPSFYELAQDSLNRDFVHSKAFKLGGQNTTAYDISTASHEDFILLELDNTYNHMGAKRVSFSKTSGTKTEL